MRQWVQRLKPGRLWLILSIALVVVIVVLLIFLPTSSAQSHRTSLASPTPANQNTPIAQENRKDGTTEWQLDAGSDFTRLQGYAGAVSVLPGAHVTLYISAATPMTYDLAVYRIGWYGGKGGYRYFAQDGLTAQQQGVWSEKQGLMGCSTCTIDPKTRMVVAHWQPSFDLVVGANWPTGVYLVKLHGEANAETYITFVVRDASAATSVLASLPVNTYQAYNPWGGYSLYGKQVSMTELLLPERATKVSFDRPYGDVGAGAGDFLMWDIHSVRWLERNNYDVSYTTNIDISQQPLELLRHRVFLSLGHDEYWDKPERDALENARDRGVSLGFWGADDGDWQVRLESNGRVVVCYKVISNSTPDAAPQNDPAYPHHLDVLTSKWGDRLLRRPQVYLLGLSYHSIVYNLPMWTVPAGPLDPIAQAAGLTPGMQLPGGLVGYEYDGQEMVTPPAPLHILGETTVVNYKGLTDLAYTAYYIAPSGAIVFDAGTIYWAYGLDAGTVVGARLKNYLGGNEHAMKLNGALLDAMLAASPRAPIS